MTPKEMAAVMVAFEDGKPIDCRQRISLGAWQRVDLPSWDWTYWEYRVHPEPPKPREVWMCDCISEVFASRARAEKDARALNVGYRRPDIIHFREVVGEDKP
jgi:hypothetical protein